jgi:hypothetical protein
MSALLHFSRVPAVFVSHSGFFWADAPPRLPRIRRYVAVDHRCREWLAAEHGVAESQLRVIYNSVDLDRFKPRGPLPARPRRALLFSNYANEHTHLGAVREACARTGLELEVVGSGVNNVCDHPEAILGRFDLVFAKARSALEAMAVGAAVVLCGAEGCGPLVRTDLFGGLRRYNFGARTLTGPVTADALVGEVGRYDPQEAAAVSARVRAEAGLDGMVTDLLDLYAEVLAEPPPEEASGAGAESRAVAAYLRSLEPPLFRYFAAEDKIMHLEAEVRRLAVLVSQATVASARRSPSALFHRLLARAHRRGWWARSIRPSR